MSACSKAKISGRPLSATVAAIAAGLFSAGTLAATVADVPALDSWSDSNALTVNPDSVEEGRTYLYPDAVTRDTDASGARDGTGSRGYIHWDIDSGLGEPPGIQVVTNDYDFPRRNCVMASGTDATSGEQKTCSDPQGSAKRIWLTVTETDVPVDIVFNTGTADAEYDDGIDTSATDFEIGRIYRVIQKLANHTGERIQGFRMELGFGTGDDFEPASFAEDDVAFELRAEVDRRFFGEADANPPDYIDAHDDPDADCTACHESASGPLRYRKIWQPEEYATFSPKMFDIEEGGRFVGRAGYFDDEPAGLVPPQDVEDLAAEKSQYIASFDSDVPPAADPVSGIVGPTTANYFDIPSNQGAGAGLSGNILGYLLPNELVTTGIYRDDDGDPATEGELVAWWDGSDWRYGNEQGFAVVSDSQLAAWAERPLSEDEVLEPPRYEAAPLDDIRALNVDTFIYIGEDFDPAAHPTLTLRYEATSVAAGTITGTEAPPWTGEGNVAPALETYLEPDDGGGGGSDDADDDNPFGCTYSRGASFDPLLPVLLASAAGWIAWRARRRNGSRA